MSERTTEARVNDADPPAESEDTPPANERTAPELPAPGEERNPPEHLHARQAFVRGLREVERWGFDARSHLMAQRTAIGRASLPENADACDIEAYIAGRVLAHEGHELADTIATALRSLPFLLDPRSAASAARLFDGVCDVTPDFLPWLTQVFQRCVVLHELTNVLLEEARHLEHRLASWKEEHLEDADAAATIAAHVSTSLPFSAISTIEAEVDRDTRPFSATWKGLFRSKRIRERQRLRRFAEAGLHASIELGTRRIQVAPLPTFSWPDA